MNNNLEQQAINDRLYARNIPPTLLEPSLPSRPVNTKYVHLQDIPPPLPLYTTELNYGHYYNKYDNNEIFNPGDRAGPWIGFSSNIDVESILRDQLHKTNCKSNYKPDYKSSDLYNVHISVASSSTNDNQNIKEFPYLLSNMPSFNSPKTKQQQQQQIQPVTNNQNQSQTQNSFNTCTRLSR